MVMLLAISHPFRLRIEEWSPFSNLNLAYILTVSCVSKVLNNLVSIHGLKVKFRDGSNVDALHPVPGKG